jgi:hypothetical protein
MTKDEALKLALEYIETNAHERRHVRWAIKEALAQPAQEPVAWMSQGGDVSRSKTYFEEMGFMNLIPLYTTPPAAQRPWVGLTEDEVIDVFKEKNAIKFARAIEAKLKEKNT